MFEDSFFRIIFGIFSDYKLLGGGEVSFGGYGGGVGGSGKEKGGKLIILGLFVKKGFLVMLEKEWKKDSLRLVEYFFVVLVWMYGEDVVFCVVVYEYGGNW